MSLSARRAWIEIRFTIGVGILIMKVALRKESVDRNAAHVGRRKLKKVALRKESVDRNYEFGLLWSVMLCRSPQGERG